MDLKQRLIEGMLVGVVGGLVATAIGGVGVLAYNEMKQSRNQLAETTKVTKQLNQSSITGIDRMTTIEKTLSSLDTRINKLEEENKILAAVNSSNSRAISLISEALRKVGLSDDKEAVENIKKAEKFTKDSSAKLERLPDLTAEREKIRTQQKQQQTQLESFRSIQQQQQEQQQQQQQKAW